MSPRPGLSLYQAAANRELNQLRVRPKAEGAGVGAGGRNNVVVQFSNA